MTRPCETCGRDGKAESVLEQLTRLSQMEQLEVITRSLQTPARLVRCDIDVTPFREAFLVAHMKHNLSAATCAERMGWLYGHKPKHGKPRGDGTRLKRRLGLEAENSGKGYFTVRRHVSYETAVALCDALGMEYTEVGV